MSLTAWLLIATHAAAVFVGLWLGSKIWSTSAAAPAGSAEQDAVDGAGAKAELAARTRAEGIEHAPDDDIQRRVAQLRERGRAGK